MTTPAGTILPNEAETMAAGRSLATDIQSAGIETFVIYLVGDLGAGKTTFTRGFLGGMGHEGRVPSPTYTLVEPYELFANAVFHVDLYRLQSVDEVDALALGELISPTGLLLVEWPEHGGDRLPPADLRIELSVVPEGRNIRMQGVSDAGIRLLSAKTY
ncbi:MAG: tRNA (adenosine(37)-N6)-threonylcarbamoyltransferase complex ATPase subunit type 1 TsaE [Gammaproteobacteria bacterium]|nr:tRNA (adenosine(37)-N6)-threonylcarbamoyltransferase complex ATPase subunit type 1 TsaE [Gammaproteobacteria bacterium]